MQTRSERNPHMVMAESAVRELLVQAAGKDAFIEVVKINPDDKRIEVVCSYVGRLIGKDRTKIHELQDKSGWVIRIRPWAMKLFELETELNNIESFRRLTSLKEGPEVFETRAYFTQKPEKKVLTTLRAKTGWQIIAEEEDEIPAEEVCRIVAQEHPEAAVKSYQDVPGTNKVYVYAVNIGPLIGPGGKESKRLARMTGKKLTFEDVDDAPNGAKLLEQENDESSEEETPVEVEIIQTRCRVCLGQKFVHRPVVGLYGITWNRVSCPLCDSAILDE
jgi:predicted PilT family ATPase